MLTTALKFKSQKLEKSYMATKPTYEELEQKVAYFESQSQKYKNFDLVSIFKGLESTFPIGISDPNGKLIYVNEQLVQLWGFSDKREIVGRSLIDFWEGDGIYKTIKDLQQQGWSQGIDIGKKRDGTFVNVAYNAIMCSNANNEPLYLLGQFFDISDRIRLESHLRNTRKMEALGTLASGIAHEFNNLLGVILGNAELSFDEMPEGNPSKEFIGEIISAVSRGKGVVRQIVNYTKKIPGKQRPLNLNTVVNKSLKLIRGTIPSTIKLRQEFMIDPAMVLSDESDINQILMSLCSNSAHAMAETSGILKIKLEAVTIDDQSEIKYDGLSIGDYIKLTVKDTGEGIDPKNMNRIMDPYFTTKEVDKGLGMGLAVVSGLVKKHDGAIRIISDVGKGTTAEVLFPTFKGDEKTETSIVEELHTDRECILLVDDVVSLVKIGVNILERQGYRVIGKTSSVEALSLFQKDPDYFDLIITDMEMPDMTGIELTKELILVRPNIPILLVSGHGDRINMDLVKEVGIREYLSKPVMKSELITKVRHILDEAKLSPQ